MLYGPIFTYLLSVIVYNNLLGVYKSQVSLIKIVIFKGDSIIVLFLRDIPFKVTLYGIYNSTLSLTSSLPPLSLP